MYLEERVGQLEHITVEHGKQIEMIATGLAALTSAVNSGFQDVRSDLRAQDERMDSLDTRMDRLDARIDSLDSRMDRLDNSIDRMEA